MVSRGKKEWIPVLKEMWKEAFGDQDNVIEAFYHTLYREELTWCWVEEGRLVSVIYGIPAKLWLDDCGHSIAVCYLYAGATAAGERGKGYYGNLFCSLVDLAAKQKTEFKAFLLVPAKGLLPYYENLGFHVILSENGRRYGLKERGSYTGAWQQSCSNRESEGKKKPSMSEISVHRIGAREYGILRSTLLGKAGFVEWDNTFLEFAVDSAEKSGGAALEVIVEGEHHILLGELAGSCINVIETTLPETYIFEVVNNQKQWNHCNEIFIKGMELMSTNIDKILVRPYFRIPLD